MECNVPDMLNEYAEESAINGMPRPDPCVEMYQMLERSGALHTFGAFADGRIVGYLTMICNVLPHYSRITAVTESFFVMKVYRNKGLGIKLLKMAEKEAKAMGAVGFLISAPYGGKLSQVMKKSKTYRQTNEVFFRGLND